jgi:hypothetical protein
MKLDIKDSADIRTSCYAVTALWIFIADWLDHHEHPTATGPPTGEVTANTVLQSVASSSCTPHSPAFGTTDVVHRFGLSLPLLNLGRHYLHREPLYFGRYSRSGCMRFWLVGQRCAFKLASG